jgi:hypothetical protein
MMKKNKNKNTLSVIALILFFASLFLLHPENKAEAQGEPDLWSISNGNPYYDPTTGKMTTAEEKTKELNQMYPSSSTSSPTSGGAYKNQEKIPGFDQTSSFPDYLKQLVNFGFAAIGIMAMFMLMIGAYQYLMAAGNIAKEESAKTTISSAFSGLVLGLVAFLLLKTINPDLVAFKLSNLTGGLTGQNTSQSGTGTTNNSGGKGTGSGNCEPVQSGPCSEASLASTCLGSSAYQASSICNKESGGGAGSMSGSDKCQTGESFSVGLFQINLTVHNIGGLDCPSAFSAKNYACTVSNQALYNQCVQAAQDPTTNIAKACEIGKNGSSWNAWGANKGKNGCGF